MPASSLAAIEEEANTMLAEDLEVTEQVMPRTEAEALGAMALFGEKYGDMVRVVSIGGDWSRELCGGTHMNTSGQLGRITLVGEESTGSGVRRLEAFVGDRAYGYNAREHVLVSQLSELLKVRADDLPQRVDALVRRVHEAERRVDAMRQARLLARAADIAAGASGDPVLLATFDAGEDGAIEDLRALAGDVRARLGEGRPTVVAMAGQAGGRAVIVVATNGAARDRGVRAGVLAKAASGVLGGGGGGKDDMAQGGGARPDRMAEAFAVLRQEVAD
ncbi:MAG: hypothetical protein LBK59_04040 [Bifidobacteriaceae bacterium]|nr:hypothetical protein [Bifidobacteriaceae bacterium]